MAPIFFFGLSGAGKSTLMQSLCALHPHLFSMPSRLTTRPPKTGDVPGELEHVSREELLAMDARGELLFVMRQSEAVDSPLSAYRSSDLSASGCSGIPLLFCSIFNASDAQRVPGALVVHVRGDWHAGLSLRGGSERDARTALNESVEKHFRQLDAIADVSFTNTFSEATTDAQGLFVMLVHARAESTQSIASTRAHVRTESMDIVTADRHPPWPHVQHDAASISLECVTLGDVGPFIISGNVRRLSARQLGVDSPCKLAVRPGVGHWGDVVVVDVLPTGCNDSVSVRDADGTFRVGVPGRALRVVALLGNRESSTHVNGGVPPGGIHVGPSNTPDSQLNAGVQVTASGETASGGTHGADAAWLAGESGLVGVLWEQPTMANTLAEHSVACRTVGIVCFPKGHVREGTPVRANDVALRVTTGAVLSTPIVVVAGTSAEAGKTTMCEKLIRGLTERHGLRVAGIKATGTGGTQDSRRHRHAGAVVSFDQVDSGLPSTYVPENDFAERAMTPYLAAQDECVDVIVVELGGDIMWANNATLLKIPAFVGCVVRAFVIANDPMAAIGARVWLAAEAPLLSSTAVSLVASPFRNLAGMQQRADALGFPPFVDPNDAASLCAAAVDAMGKFAANFKLRSGHNTVSVQRNAIDAGLITCTPAPPPPTVEVTSSGVDASAGQAVILEDYWRQNGGMRAACLIPGHSRMSFELGTNATAIDRVTDVDVDFESLLRAAHARAGNVVIADSKHELVFGVGARQLLHASLYALRCIEGTTLRLTSVEPYYPLLARMGHVAPDTAVWAGVDCKWTGGMARSPSAGVEIADGPLVDIVVLPSNPTGAIREALPHATHAIHDLSYAWPHLMSSSSSLSPDSGQPAPSFPRCDSIMLFSLSKLSGHAGTRLGWAWVRNRDVARRMREYVRHMTIGVSGDAMERARTVLRRMFSDAKTGCEFYDGMVQHVRRTLSTRWSAVRLIVERSGGRLLLHGDETPTGWCYALFRDGADGSLWSHLSDAGVRATAGDQLGMPGLIRVNMMVSDDTFKVLTCQLVAFATAGL
eukprot:Opistho-2@14278